MINYEMFKEIVKENIKDYMPLEYRNAVVEVIGENKVNGVQDILAVRSEKDVLKQPMNRCYDMYQECGDLKIALEKMADEYNRMAELNKKKLEIDVSQIKDRVVMMLINTEQNKEMLADLPHREFQDLSVIYRYVVSQGEQGMASFKITNSIMDQIGMTPDELFRCAAENTKKLLPLIVCRMEDVLFGMPGEDGIPDGLADLFEMDTDPKESMWIITNSIGVNGAVSMLYDENLNRLAERMGTDLYIMPSSMHEVIAVSVELGDPEELAEMVQGANMSVVELEDRLSNNVYHYDKDLRELKLATQVPNQRLDGVVAEPELIYGTEPKITFRRFE